MFGRRACCLPRGFVNRIARRLLPRDADCDAGICCASLKRRLPSRDARAGGDTDERLVRHPRGRPRAGIRGFDDRQVAVLLKVMRSSGESAVTKSDLALVKSELTRMDASLRREITATRTELRSPVAELRAEIASSAAELRGEIATAKAELRAGMNAMANKLLLSQLPVAGRERRFSCRRPPGWTQGKSRNGRQEWATRSRGRDAGCPAPPAQIRTCPLRHTAPTSGNDGRPRRPPYPTPACVTATRLCVRSVLW